MAVIIMGSARGNFPPVQSGLCAGRRGFAGHSYPQGDALLLWWRTGEDRYRKAVLIYLARMAVSRWDCPIDAAKLAIEHAVLAVATRHPPPAIVAAAQVKMRKADFLRLRGQAICWLKHGIDQAVQAYQTGTRATRI